MVDDFDNLNDIFFKFGLNVSDDEIPRIQAMLHEKLGDIMVPVTTGHGSIDLIIPGVHKANGLRILQQRWGIDDSEVVAFGDSGNDVEMLRQSGSALRWPMPDRILKRRALKRRTITMKACWM
jgi:hydroxymethylpyrimidine pyrophosphatase-like HAD family hydrolase